MVWSKVAATQARLREKVGREIVTDSSSSLELTLESDPVRESVGPYLKALLPAVEGKEGVVGFAYAINGKVNSAEVYASRGLFRKLWPKLLRASAVEALAEREAGTGHGQPTAEAVREFLADAEWGKAYLERVGARVEAVMQETDKALLFETRDRERQGGWIHRNYLAK
jgi:hypothetical protein